MFKFLPIFFYILCKISNVTLTREFILELNDENFENNIKLLQSAVVVFFSDYSDLLNFLESDSESCDLNDVSIHLVFIDCNDFGKTICLKHNIRKSVEVKIFKNGVLEKDYKGPVLKSWVVKYILSETHPNYVVINTEKEYEDFINLQEKPTILGYFEENTDLKKSFLEVAKNNKHIEIFALITDKNIIKKHNLKDDIILHRPIKFENKYEEKTVRYKGESNTTEIENFILNNKHGLVGVLKKDNLHEFDYPICLIYFDVDFNNPPGLLYCRNKILQVANKFFSKLNFAIASKRDYPETQNSCYPVVSVLISKDKNFIMDTKFSVENVTQFLGTILENLEGTVSVSEKLTKNNEILKDINEDSLKMIMEEKIKNMLLFLYNPKEELDANFLKSFEDLEISAKENDVILAQMDVSKNKLNAPLYFYKNPSIFWIPKNLVNEPHPFVYDLLSTHNLNEFILDSLAELKDDVLLFDNIDIS